MQRVVTIFFKHRELAEYRIVLDGPFDAEAFVARALEKAENEGVIDGAKRDELRFSIDDK